MEIVRTILSGALLGSAGLGTIIVLDDRYLWYAAPSHAYGLVAFIALDIGLAIALWWRSWLGSLLSFTVATVQALAMLGDILTYTAPYVPQRVFRSYLLSDQSFLALLTLQSVILLLALGSTNLRYDYTIIRAWIQAHAHFSHQ